MSRPVAELPALPGARVFRYRHEDGRLVKAAAGAVNDYFKEIVGRRHSVKEFRTWTGTVVCACHLRLLGPAPTRREPNRMLKAAVQTTPQVLGTTPAVCKSVYIMPRVLDLYQRRVVVPLDVVPHPEEVVRHCHGLHPAERATLNLLTTHGHA